MQRHKSRLAFLVLVLATTTAAHAQLATPSGLPRGDAKAAGFDPTKLKAIDAQIAKSVEERRLAGAAALVAHQGKVVHLATVGMRDAEAGVPISEATIYRIASMTKPITSVAALMLVEQGKLSLDDPVSKYIPEFGSVRVLKANAKAGEPLEQITEPARSPITVKQLLTHTSGLAYGLFDRPIVSQLYRQLGVADGLIETPGTVLENSRRLAGAPLLFQPGSNWEYGLNTDVLGAVVEVASGQSLAEFMHQQIFEPLRMRDTHFVLPAEKRSRLAALYAPDSAKQIRRVGEGPQQAGAARYSATYSTSDQSQYYSGGAGLASTVGDYARFLQMLLAGGELNGQRLLKPETVAQMTSNQIGDFAPLVGKHGDKFGFGFGVVTDAGKSQDIASVGSYSWGGAFYTYFLVDPKEEIVAIFAAQMFPCDLTLHADFKQAIYAARQP